MQSSLAKSFSITGLEKILPGGFRPGEPAVIRGAPGTGKTMLTLAYALQDQTPSIFCTFDEDPERIRQYLDCFKTDSSQLHIMDCRALAESPFTGGDMDLGGLMARLKHNLNKTNSTRVIMDAIDVLFDDLPNTFGIRQGLRDLLGYARQNNLQFICTMGMDKDTSAQKGIIEYAADCVIHLSQDVSQNLVTRNLRIIKSRGRGYGTNIYPFMIDEQGFTLAAVTFTPMDQTPSSEVISSGNAGLDKLLAGGVYTDSSVMISGESGTGKSLLCQSIVESLCSSGSRVLYCSFEESPEQIRRNAVSIGLDLQKHSDSGLLKIRSARSVEKHLEQHLIEIFRAAELHAADVIVVDPISSIADIASSRDFKNFAVRLSSFTKSSKKLLVLTELVNNSRIESSERYISSLADTWIRLRRIESNGEFSRLVFVHKSRGFASSNQVMEFVVTDSGLSIEPPYIGPGRLVYGSAKVQAELWDAKEVELKRNLVDSLRAATEFLRKNIDTASGQVASESRVKLAALGSDLINAERELEYLSNAVDANKKLRN